MLADTVAPMLADIVAPVLPAPSRPCCRKN